MKISILSTFYPFRGGIAQFNALLYRELEKDHDVKAYTFKRQYPDLLFPGQTQYVTQNDKADKIPSCRVLDTINPFSYFSTVKRMKKDSPDLIITKYWMTFFAPSLGFVLGRFKNKAIRISILDNVIPHEKRFFDNVFNRYFLRRNDGFVVMSDKVLKDLLIYRPEAPFIRIDHPVYNQFGDRIDKKDAAEKLGIELKINSKILLFFGIIRDYKGLDLLIDALSLLDDSYQLIIAGEVYGSFDKYQDQIDRLGLSKRICLFNHYIPDDRVSPYFSIADVCVLPYRSATQSGIIGISKHFEVPVIATDVGGLKESVSHERTGLIVESILPEEIAKTVRHFFSSDLNNSCRDLIRFENEQNTWDSFAKKLTAFASGLTSR